MNLKLSIVILLILILFNSMQVLGLDQKIEDFPFILLNAPDDNVVSYFDNEIVNNPLSIESAKIFNDNIVYSFNSTYALYNKVNTINYYVMVFDFDMTINNTENIKRGNIIGNGSEPKLLVFCETIDPFLVINGSKIPSYYEGFYWFDGYFLFPSGLTDWFNFEPASSIEKILNNIILENTKEERQSFSLYPAFRYSFLERLNEYPRQMTTDERNRISACENMLFGRNITTHINEIMIGKGKYYLCWQRGFNQHLEKEYILNNDIWLYSMSMVYSEFDNCGYIFLRDFKLESLENMYENRMNIINAEQ